MKGLIGFLLITFPLIVVVTMLLYDDFFEVLKMSAIAEFLLTCFAVGVYLVCGAVT